MFRRAWPVLACLFLGCGPMFRAVGVNYEPRRPPTRYIVHCEPGPNAWPEHYVEEAVWQHDRFERMGRACEVWNTADEPSRLLSADELAAARDNKRYKRRMKAERRQDG